MATASASINPANGRVHSTQSPIAATVQETNTSKYLVKFNKDTDNDHHYSWFCPGNYFSGNPVVRIKWRANATTGDVRWLLGMTYKGQGISTASHNADVATGSTAAVAYQLNETTITSTSSGIGTNKMCFMYLRRAGADASDTLAVDAEVEEISIEYTSDPTVTKQYIWIPANAFTIPSGSGTTLGRKTTSTSNQPSGQQSYELLFPDTDGNTAQCQFFLPSTFNGNLKFTLALSNGSDDASSHKFFVDSAAVGIGDPVNSAFSGSPQTVTVAPGSSSTMGITQTTLTTSTPVAGGVINLKVERDETDTSTITSNLQGIHIEYDISSASPAPVRLTPATGIPPSASAATMLQVNDSNRSGWNVQYADGSDLAWDLNGYIPGIFGSGGTCRILFRASATGNCRWRVDFCSPGNGALSDATLTTGTAQNVAVTTIGDLTEATFDVSSGLAARDILRVRVVREGGHASDTIGALAELLDCLGEVNVTS